MNKATQQSARETLLSILKPGDTVYTRLNHVSKSGMMRVIDLFVIRDNEPHRITWTVCEAMGDTYNKKHDGLKMTGCGMDIGFAAVYNLGHTLWPNGTPEPHGTRNCAPDSDGGYALKQRWL